VGVRGQRSHSTVQDILEFFISVRTVRFCYKYVINLYLSFLLLPLFILYVVHGNIAMGAQELLNAAEKHSISIRLS
jgi:hypothetical protein